jgi:hypothetical protein
MNVVEATIALHIFFQNNDCFEMSEDYDKLLIVTDKGVEKEKAAVLAGLEKLKEISVVYLLDRRGMQYWILVKNLASSDQTVALPGELCFRVATVVNEFCDIIGDNADKSCPYALTAQDVHNLTVILGIMQQKLNETEKESDSAADSI